MKTRKHLLGLAVCLGIVALVAGQATANYMVIRGTPVTEGQMRVASADFERIERSQPEATDMFILKSTRVNAEISGVVARVVVEHEFVNPYQERLEAVYVFPLPEDSAVDRYWFRVGETIVRGVVKERQQARREYEQARDEGRKASLLEEERDDIFTQSVANIPPGGTVVVHTEYVHPLKIDGDNYLLRFPMVVGPRYIPGAPTGNPNVGRGWAVDTDQVPDASRITPRPLPPGMRNGNDVHITVTIDAGMPIQALTGVSHEIEQQTTEETKAVVTLKNGPTIANKDFLLEYRLAGEGTTMATLAHSTDGDGYFMCVLQPKWNVSPAEVTPREVIMLLDTSGSMSGPAMSQLRVFAQEVLGTLNPADTFRILSFSNRCNEFRSRPSPASTRDIEEGKSYIRRLQSGGGTEMLPALQKALGSGRNESSRVRYLVLVTDALVGNDDSILGYLSRPEFSDVRVFPVAMGAAPNHYLISRAAEMKRGFALQVANQDNATEIAGRLTDKISKPIMTDLQIDFGGLKVTDVLPGVLPDLYADRPLIVLGRYATPGTGEITLRGNVGGQAIEARLPLDLPAQQAEHDSLGPLWARAKIREIWNRDLGSETRQGKQEITEIALRHQLVSRYTSFVAIEEEITTEPVGNLRTQDVRTMLPEGMTDQAIGRGNMASSPSRSTQATPSRPTVAYNAPPVARSAAPVRSSSSSHSSSSSSGHRRGNPVFGGGGGGAVEWLFLGALGPLFGGRLVSSYRKRGKK